MRISAKADYAVRAVVELAAAEGDKPVKAERVATAQEIPLNFLENILGELRHAGVVRSHRGAEGGFRLAKPAQELTRDDGLPAGTGTQHRDVVRPHSTASGRVDATADRGQPRGARRGRVPPGAVPPPPPPGRRSGDRFGHR